MKLKLKHLAPYLPYILRLSSTHIMHTIHGLGNINHVVNSVNEGDSKYKPILRPLSDLLHYDLWFLLNENKIDYFIGTEYENYLEDIVNKRIPYSNIEFLPYGIVTYLLKNHYDIFGLIGEGLAIDINTLK